MMYEHYTQMSRRDFNSLKKLNSFYFDVESENRTWYLEFSSYSRRKVEEYSISWNIDFIVDGEFGDSFSSCSSWFLISLTESN